MKLPRRIIALSIVVAALCAAPTAHATEESPTSTVPSNTSPTDSVETTSTTSTTSTLPPVSKTPRKKVAIAFSRVVLSEQRAYFYDSRRRLIATLPVSTGLDDTTPVGTFKVFSRSAQTFYIPSPNEKMKWMTRFTKGRENGNIGFHGIPYKATKSGNIPFPTPLGKAPSSHGCIRMRNADAKWVFENMKIGTVVTVVRSRR
jgi:lipoprotein-anchoring transpeptidase ErfK/SrfK